MRQAFIALVGHNAAGKTHVSKQLERDLKISRVNADDFRLFVQEHIHYFHDLDISISNDKYNLLNQLVMDYRFDMSWLLLKAGESVLYDGSGATREWRERYLNHVKNSYSKVVRILIFVDINENELLGRLERRGASRTKQYHHHKKAMFEPPTADEADLLLTYTQDNYANILSQIKEFLSQGS